MKGSFSLWEDHKWLCFFWDFHLLSVIGLSENARGLCIIQPDCFCQAPMTRTERGDKTWYVRIQDYVPFQKLLRQLFQHKLLSLLLEFLLPLFGQTYICTTISTANHPYLMLQTPWGSFCSIYFHFNHNITKHVTWPVILFLLRILVILLTKYSCILLVTFLNL